MFFSDLTTVNRYCWFRPVATKVIGSCPGEVSNPRRMHVEQLWERFMRRLVFEVLWEGAWVSLRWVRWLIMRHVVTFNCRACHGDTFVTVGYWKVLIMMMVLNMLWIEQWIQKFLSRLSKCVTIICVKCFIWNLKLWFQ